MAADSTGLREPVRRAWFSFRHGRRPREVSPSPRAHLPTFGRVQPALYLHIYGDRSHTMPWGWGKKEAPPTDPAVKSGGSPGDSEPPLPSSVREPTGAAPSGSVTFRIDKVTTILGMGCVVMGEVIEGILRAPLTMRVVTGAPRPDVPASVQVVMLMAHHSTVTELAPGTPAGLTLRGVSGPPVLPGGIRRKWPLEVGDRLVAP